VEILGLAIGGPIGVGTRQRKVELVEQPCGVLVAWGGQQPEDLARLAALEIIERGPALDAGRYWQW
jgi:hypothetical protein